MSGGYLSRETAPKERTGSQEIEAGSIKLMHLSPELFLELQKISLHTHEGTISVPLPASSTPESIRGYNTGERMEHYEITWTGAAAGAASVALTFGTAFGSAPNVVAMASGRASADIKVTSNAITSAGCTLYWKLDSGTATEVKLNVIVIGR